MQSSFDIRCTVRIAMDRLAAVLIVLFTLLCVTFATDEINRGRVYKFLIASCLKIISDKCVH